MARRAGFRDASALVSACDGGDAATVRRLLKAGADPDEVYQGAFPVIVVAAMNGHVDAVQALLHRTAGT